MGSEGKGKKKIAEYLFIGVKTVEKHRAKFMKKLNIHNIQALTALALEKGLVTRESVDARKSNPEYSQVTWFSSGGSFV